MSCHCRLILLLLLRYNLRCEIQGSAVQLITADHKSSGCIERSDWLKRPDYYGRHGDVNVFFFFSFVIYLLFIALLLLLYKADDRLNQNIAPHFIKFVFVSLLFCL